MAPKFKAWTIASSSSSGSSSEEESASYEYSAQSIEGIQNQEQEDRGISGSSTPWTAKTQEIAPQDASTFELPNLQPHQHSALFYLSLVEGRCKTQAMKTLNAKRSSEKMLSEDHPDVCDLAQRLFVDMSRELSKLGILPAEFAGVELASLRAGYLASFDQILGSAISRQAHEPQGVAEGSVGSGLILRGTTPSTLAKVDGLVVPNMYTMVSPKRYSIGAHSQASLAATIMNIRVIGKLGVGGYGSVYKACQQTDNKSYAIKVVPLKSNAKTRDELIATCPKVKEALKEVLAMASLSHDNVVQYHWAWLHRSEEPKDSEELRRSTVKGLLKGVHKESHSATSRLLIEDVSHQSGEDFFEHETNQNFEESSAPGSDSDISSGSGSTGTGSSSTGEHSMPTDEDQSKKDVMKHKKKWHLYIAMALCDASLSKYLSPDAPSRSSSFQYRHCFHRHASIQILHKILDGLSYIHRNDIVHRDLKPANILISVNRDKAKDSYTSCIMATDCENCECLCSSDNACGEKECLSGKSNEPVYLTPRIADFGLLAKIEPSVGVNEEAQDFKVTRPPQGTKHYTAPHIKGPNKKQDIYSLGIIAFELLYKFDSQSERHNVLNKVNKHQFPDDFQDTKWKEGVIGMTMRDTEKQWDLARVRRWLVEMEEEEKKKQEEETDHDYVCNGS